MSNIRRELIGATLGRAFTSIDDNIHIHDDLHKQNEFVNN
jgi:hypothetical protein